MKRGRGLWPGSEVCYVLEMCLCSRVLVLDVTQSLIGVVLDLFFNATLWLRASRSVRVSYRAQLFNPRLYFPLIPAFFSLTEFLSKWSIILYALIFFHISVRASQINIYQTYSDTLQSWTANIDSTARCVLNFCLSFCWRECQQARLWCKWRQIYFRFWMFLEERPVVEVLILYICITTSSHMLVKRMLCQWEKEAYLRLTSPNSTCFEHRSYRAGNNQQSSVRGLFHLQHSLWRNNCRHVCPGNCETSIDWQILDWCQTQSIIRLFQTM